VPLPTFNNVAGLVVPIPTFPVVVTRTYSLDPIPLVIVKSGVPYEPTNHLDVLPDNMFIPYQPSVAESKKT
jgi:hypothetical protein